jgi:Tfp pilus assembly protein PilE
VARQLRNRRSVLGVTLVDVIGAIAVFPILAALSVPSFPNVTEAYRHREALRKVERAQLVRRSPQGEGGKAAVSAGNNLLTKDRGQ